jgi:hypothetical protein
MKMQCWESGSSAFLTPGSGMGKKKSGSGSGMTNPDHISVSLETIFWVEILKTSLMQIRDGKNRIRDGNKNSDPASTFRIRNIEFHS